MEKSYLIPVDKFEYISRYHNAGGADPVSAIANALGGIADLGTVFAGKEKDIVKQSCGRKPTRRRKREYEIWLKCAEDVRKREQAKTDDKKEQAKERKENKQLIVAGISAVILIGVGLVIFYNSNKSVQPQIQVQPQLAS